MNYEFQDIPIVVVGNKQDVVREIEPGDVHEWAQNFLPQERYKKEVVFLIFHNSNAPFYILFQDTCIGMFSCG